MKSNHDYEVVQNNLDKAYINLSTAFEALELLAKRLGIHENYLIGRYQSVYTVGGKPVTEFTPTLLISDLLEAEKYNAEDRKQQDRLARLTPQKVATRKTTS